jgi:hypothetical protein
MGVKVLGIDMKTFLTCIILTSTGKIATSKRDDCVLRPVLMPFFNKDHHFLPQDYTLHFPYQKQDAAGNISNGYVI